MCVGGGGLVDEASLLHSTSVQSAQSTCSEYAPVFWLMGNFGARH